MVNKRHIELASFSVVFLLRTLLGNVENNYCASWFSLLFIGGFGYVLPGYLVLLASTFVTGPHMSTVLSHVRFGIYLSICTIPSCFLGQWMLRLWS
jgi:hypothetical protein